MTDQEARIEELETEIQKRDNTILLQQNSINELKRQVENLTEMLLQMRQDKFGSSSERTKIKDDLNDDQLCFFNEAEVEQDPKAEEPVKQDPKGRIRKKKSSRKEMIIGDIPVEVIPLKPDEKRLVCPYCDSKLKSVGTEIVREEVRYIPASLKLLRYVRDTYGCPHCKNTDHPYMVKPIAPTPVLNHSAASPSSVAWVMYQKYGNAVPLYRQEAEWERMGMKLTRATMANWIIRCSDDYFDPLIRYMHRRLLERDVLHADETPVQVLKEDGKPAESKSYMWLYRTGNDGRVPIILYDYRPSRSGDNADEYLKGFHGYLHSDGYSGYNKVTDVTRCGCWAHLRRKFVEAVPKGKASGSGKTNAEIGIDYCDRLFRIEDELKDLSPEDRKRERLDRETPVLKAFWSWLDTVEPLRGSGLAKAVIYARNQKPYMENYLEDGRCSISNNAAENGIRPFVLGRKNWLFADTPKGAAASARVYSLIETAKANDLDPFTYLQLLLMYMPDWDRTEEQLERMMPWSDFIRKQNSD